MKSIVNLHPVHEFRTLEEMFDRVFGQTPQPSTLTLPIDVLETPEALVVRTAVPGMKPEDIEIQVEKNVLTIRGETSHTEEAEGTKFYRREVALGKFSRSVRLPENLNLEAVGAKFEHGMLTVTLPKAEEAKPQIIRIPVTPSAE